MMLGPLEFVPRWLFVLVIAALTGLFLHETHQHDKVRVELAEVKRIAAEERAARAEEALRHAQEKLRLIATHQETMAAKEKDHAEKIAVVDARARADAATVGRLRKQIATFAASGGGTCQAPAVVLDRAESPAEVLGGLLGESLELLGEGRARLELRDAEVNLLLEQIDADRAACQSGDKPRK